MASKESRDTYQYEDNDPLQKNLGLIGIDAANHLVAADVQRYYPSGLLTPGTVLTSSLELWGWLPDSLLQLIHAAAIRYVLDHPELLTDGVQHVDGALTIVPRLMEMDGDPGREWLVAVTLSQYQVDDWLVFDEDATGRPQPLSAPWGPFYVGFGAVNLDATHDFTGDGLAEIVVTTNQYMMGSAWGYVDVYHWMGQGWKDISEVFLESVGDRTGEHSEAALGDFNGDGRIELRVTANVYLGYGCTYDVVRDYAWNGRELARVGADPARPLTGGCLLVDAMNATSGSVARIRGLERALARLETESGVADRLAWTRVQLAMAYQSQGLNADAAAMLQTAVQAEGQGEYLHLLHQAMAEAGPQPRPVCEWLYARAQAQGDAGALGTDIDEDLAWGGNQFPYSLRPEAVCPLQGLDAQLLSHAHLPDDQPPANGLKPLGMTFKLIEPLQMDADPELEWAGVFAGSDGRLAVFDAQGSAWTIALLDGEIPDKVAVSAYWPTGAVQADLLIAAPFADRPGGWNCPPDQTTLLLMRAAQHTTGWQVTGTRYGCADPGLLYVSDPGRQLQVVTLLEQSKHDSTTNEPTWLKLAGYPAQRLAGSDLLAYVAQLQADTVARRAPLTTQRAITALLAYLPTDDPAARRVAVRLLYLRGLGYELANDDPAALAAYASVLHESPGSLWAWLAWARVGT